MRDGLFWLKNSLKKKHAEHDSAFANPMIFVAAAVLILAFEKSIDRA